MPPGRASKTFTLQVKGQRHFEAIDGSLRLRESRFGMFNQACLDGSRWHGIAGNTVGFVSGSIKRGSEEVFDKTKCTLRSDQQNYLLHTGGELPLGGLLLHPNSIAVASGGIVSYFSKKCQILAPSSHYFVNYYPIKVGTQWQLKANICFRLRFRGHMFLIRWYTLKSISTLKKKSQHKYFIMNLACFAQTWNSD